MSANPSSARHPSVARFPRGTRDTPHRPTLRVVPPLTPAEQRTASTDRMHLLRYARCVIDLEPGGRITVHENAQPLLHVHAVFVRGMLAVEIANRWTTPYVRQSVRKPDGTQFVIRARRAMTNLTREEALLVLPVLLERMQHVTDSAVTHGTLARRKNGVLIPPRGWKDTVHYVAGGRASTGASGRSPKRVAARVGIERGIAWKIPTHAAALYALLRLLWELPAEGCREGARRNAVAWVASRLQAILSYRRDRQRRTTLRTFFRTVPNGQWLSPHKLLAVLDQMGRESAQHLLSELATPLHPRDCDTPLSQEDMVHLWERYRNGVRTTRPVSGFRLHPYPNTKHRVGIATLMMLPSRRFSNTTYVPPPTAEETDDLFRDADDSYASIPFSAEAPSAGCADVPF